MDLSIVIPLFNESAILPALKERMTRVLEQDFPNLNWEVILVNDGSHDDTLNGLIEIHKTDLRFKILDLSRNFGHQIAITAGMEHAQGEAVVVMDGDLQDPPEVIISMWSRFKDGVDVAYGQRRQREGESWFKLATASLFYRLL